MFSALVAVLVAKSVYIRPVGCASGGWMFKAYTTGRVGIKRMTMDEVLEVRDTREENRNGFD